MTERVFVIQMKSGLYFAGKDPDGNIRLTSIALDARGFASRWTALQVCATSQEFAGAAIQPYQTPTEPPAAPC